MSKFKPGVRVVVIDGDTSLLRKGVVKDAHEDLGIAIVKFDDGNVEKVDFNCLGIDPEAEKQAEKQAGPIEKSEITITPEEFRKISVDLIVKESKDTNVLAGLAFTAFVVKLHRALFVDEGDND